MRTPDVVIVGAGAAGVGAGLELQAHGIPFVVLEASDRVGGRAFTDRTSLPHHWDRGCHWLHCADVNPLVGWADRLGARYLRQQRIDHFLIWTAGGWADADMRQAARASLLAAFDAIYEAAGRGEDLPVSQVVPEAGSWAPAVRYILQLMASEDPELVSASGYGEYEDTDVNWPVSSGYGDLIERMAAGLPVRPGCRVCAVEQGPEGVRVETADGTVDARAAILTASTNVLLSGRIAISPGPARDLLDLIQDVPCGSYEKVAIAFRQLPVQDPGKLFCMIDAGGRSSPLDFQIAPAGQPMMIAHMAGSHARDLVAAGRSAMVSFAMERLVLAFGADVRKLVVSAATTSWQEDPFVLGGYSYTRPGRIDHRRRMIDADTGNVAFAGEAFSRQWQATAHGAYQSGRDAASRIVEMLGAGGLSRRASDA